MKSPTVWCKSINFVAAARHVEKRCVSGRPPLGITIILRLPGRCISRVLSTNGEVYTIECVYLICVCAVAKDCGRIIRDKIMINVRFLAPIKRAYRDGKIWDLTYADIVWYVAIPHGNTSGRDKFMRIDGVDNDFLTAGSRMARYGAHDCPGCWSHTGAFARGDTKVLLPLQWLHDSLQNY